jgi:hypothetical protein
MEEVNSFMLLEIIAFARQQLFDHVTIELRASQIS